MQHFYSGLRCLSIVAALGFLASPSIAQVTGARFEVVPQDILPGYVVHDILIDFDGRLTGAQMILELDSGDIYQDPVGGNYAPHPANFEIYPSLAFDSFLAFGAANSQNADIVNPGIVGGGVNIDSTNGDRVERFDETGIDIAYFPPGGYIADQQNYFVARITLSDDAAGRFRFFGSAGGVPSSVYDVPIQNGVILPEPAAALAMALLAGCSLRRRRPVTAPSAG